MKYTIIMPRCGVDMEEGVISEWKKSVGDYVAKGELLFSLETDKVLQDIMSDYEGFVREIIVQNGDAVAIGIPIAILTTTADEQY